MTRTRPSARNRDRILFSVIATLLLSAVSASAAPDARTEEILSEILALRRRHERTYGVDRDREYAVFMDFDGTIIHGDITEGLRPKEPGGDGYMGLAELAARSGFARDYGHPGGPGLAAFEARYRELVAEDHERGYAWGAAQFANLGPTRTAGLRRLVDEHFREVLRPWIFASSARFIEGLQAAGIRVYVVSASPQVFVRGAHQVFPDIPLERMTGIHRERDARRRLLDPIVNYAAGKTLRVRSIEAASKGRMVVLAGFGNSWHTDGHFLEWIAHRRGGLAVMINGGRAPRRFPGLREITQVRTLRDR